MFESSDLLLRRAAAILPSQAGYALTRRLTPVLGGDRRRWLGSVVTQKARDLLGDEHLAAAAGDAFVAEMACDDLDAVTSVAWSDSRRLASTRVVGAENLPASGPAVVTSFHFSGGFRVFDVLRARGFTPTFLHVPPRERLKGYDAAMQNMRMRYLERHLSPPFIKPGPRTRGALDRHLGDGGVVVALLDVSPAAFELRDHTSATLLGRPLQLPVGLLRLAAKHDAPVIPYDGRIEDDRRVLEFHARARGSEPEALLADVLQTCERVIRTRPWTWQGWLDADCLFAEAAEV
ncbi:MAG: hypothetical protein P8R42_27615 [Candidatus Binatia bacterium]|nr:hypothetical protein [Candidatus Binatia bacterium]